MKICCPPLPCATFRLQKLNNHFSYPAAERRGITFLLLKKAKSVDIMRKERYNIANEKRLLFVYQTKKRVCMADIGIRRHSK